MPIIDNYTLNILLGRSSHRDLSNPRNVGLESRAIQSIDYSLEEQELTVFFFHGGTYLYRQVPLDTYTQLATAESQGRYFNLYIRDQFSYERLN